MPFTFRVPAKEEGQEVQDEGWPASLAGFPSGQWIAGRRRFSAGGNMDAERAQEPERRQAEGLPVESRAGALSQARREQLEEIGPSWCPTWPVEWQQAFHLVRQHLDEGGTLPVAAGRSCVRARAPDGGYGPSGSDSTS
ncbi:hypothetical protein ACIGW0_23135 [Streptomyces bikiniensis]|uniref:Uncharacterized protein n=1 Tax=Streptomyces bikiniensis TaxID=1896 RepID=A0ABW8CXF1_STRBI